MIKIALLSETARVAIGGLLLGASSIALAQDIVPVTEPTAAPVMAPIVPGPEAPPPTPETQATDSIAPSALGDVAIERAERREAARDRAAAASRPQRQAAVLAKAVPAPQPSAAVAPDAPATASSTDAIVDNGISETAPVAVAPIENNIAEASEPAQDTVNDWLLIAGTVGALGLAGGAALAASRRRRNVSAPVVAQTNSVPLANVTPDTKVWAAMPVNSPVAEPKPVPVAAQPSFDPVFAAQPSVPLSTDPLFAPRVKSDIPVTDPLFARKAELAPVTDPIFAHLAEFVGEGAHQRAPAELDVRRESPDTRQTGASIRTLEPAE